MQRYIPGRYAPGRHCSRLYQAASAAAAAMQQAANSITVQLSTVSRFRDNKCECVIPVRVLRPSGAEC